MYYSQEQIDRANAVSLEDFLRSQGEALKRCGKDMEWKAHDYHQYQGRRKIRRRVLDQSGNAAVHGPDRIYPL